MPARIRPARQHDLPAIEALLRSLELVTTGVADHVDGFLVVEDDGQVVATAGLEMYGFGGLLRSVGVRPEYRNRGLATTLTRQLLDRALHDGIRRVYLLTTGAAGYFQRLGFKAVSRDAVDPAVQQSAEFGDAACATAQAMWLALAGDSQLEEG